MQIKKGSFKIVFIFDNFVVKFPKTKLSVIDTLMSFAELYTEKWNYIFSSKKEKEYLLPIVFIPLFPIIVMPKADDVLNDCLVEDFCEKLRKNCIGLNGKFSDIRIDNLGIYKGKVVKIDYGFPYVFYNFFAEIRFNIYVFLKKIRGFEK